jgi:hypothetical protein
MLHMTRYEITQTSGNARHVIAWGLSRREARSALDLIAEQWVSRQEPVREGVPGYRHESVRDEDSLALEQIGVYGTTDAAVCTYRIREDGGVMTHPRTPDRAPVDPSRHPW